MSRRRRAPREPVSVRFDRLEARGCASGADDEGRRLTVRGAAVGAVALVRPDRKGTGRLVEVLEPAPDAVSPACPVFGLCGGCTLQQMPLEAQRREKGLLVERMVGAPCQVVEGAPDAYGYRNKLELSWSRGRFLPVERKDESKEGDFLGFHPPGWFSRVVPVDGCPLASDAMNAAIAAVVGLGLGPAWDTRAHTGVWRHLVVREGDDGVLVTFVTTSAADEGAVRAAGDAVAAVPGVTGVLWLVTDRLAEVAEGELRAVLHGDPGLRVTLGGGALALPHDAFFQVNTPGAQILIDRIGRALFGNANLAYHGGTLLDLYCGVGAIGLALASAVDRVLGVELNPSSIAVARANAAARGVDSDWHAGPVEDVLTGLSWADPTWIVVDPPRAGLHPRAAAFLAGIDAEALVYVACNPASLGRDREILEAGGWQLDGLWCVDLFPQTGHVEAVARFTRRAAGADTAAVAPVIG